MNPVYRYFVALYASKSVPQFVKLCRAIVAKMTGNAYFPSPTPALTLVLAHIDALDTAEQATHKGSPAATTDRNAKLMVVRSDMRQLKACVQIVADANIADSQLIIESAGMAVVKKTIRTKPNLAARYGKVPTAVVLHAKAVKGRVWYQWQMSTDEKAWTDLPATLKATSPVTGLTPATVYFFRFRTQTVAGLSDWSTAVSIIAH